MRAAASSRVRRAACAALAMVFFAAGLLHITVPGPFIAITPEWVPWPEILILITGVCEITGAVGLLVPRLRSAAGIGLAVYSVCVFPANIKHALDEVVIGGAMLGWWYHGPRLAFQPVIVWWALWASQVIDWPVCSQSRAFLQRFSR